MDPPANPMATMNFKPVDFTPPAGFSPYDTMALNSRVGMGTDPLNLKAYVSPAGAPGMPTSAGAPGAPGSMALPGSSPYGGMFIQTRAI